MKHSSSLGGFTVHTLPASAGHTCRVIDTPEGLTQDRVWPLPTSCRDIWRYAKTFWVGTSKVSSEQRWGVLWKPLKCTEQCSTTKPEVSTVPSMRARHRLWVGSVQWESIMMVRPIPTPPLTNCQFWNFQIACSDVHHHSWHGHHCLLITCKDLVETLRKETEIVAPQMNESVPYSVWSTLQSKMFRVYSVLNIVTLNEVGSMCRINLSRALHCSTRFHVDMCILRFQGLLSFCCILFLVNTVPFHPSFSCLQLSAVHSIRQKLQPQTSPGNPPSSLPRPQAGLRQAGRLGRTSP